MKPVAAMTAMNPLPRGGQLFSCSGNEPSEQGFCLTIAWPLPVEPCRRTSPDVALRRAYRGCVRFVSARSMLRQHKSANLQAL